MKAASRLFAGEAAEKVYLNALRIACGCGGDMGDLAERIRALDLGRVMASHMQDMDLVARELVDSSASR